MAGAGAAAGAEAGAEAGLAAQLQGACRLCLERAGAAPLHGSLRADVQRCAGVRVSLEDNLPDSICKECLETLQMIKAFRRMVAQNEARLKWIHRHNPAGEEDHSLITPEVLLETYDTELNYCSAPTAHEISSENKEIETHQNNKAERVPHERYGKISIRVDIFDEENRNINTNNNDDPTTEPKNKRSKEMKSKEMNYPLSENNLLQTLSNDDPTTEPKKKRSQKMKTKELNNPLPENNLMQTLPCTSSSKVPENIAKKRKQEPENANNVLHIETEKSPESSTQDSTSKSKVSKKKRKIKNDNSTTPFDNKEESLESNVEKKKVDVIPDSNTLATSTIKLESVAASIVSRRKSNITLLTPEELVCQVCKKEFEQWKAFYHHVRLHNKSHHCPVCEKGFASKNDLAKHVRIHTGEKPYKCSLCDKAFTQKGTMKAHEVSVHQSKYFDQ